MSQQRSIHKRKFRKVYGYIFLSVGIFCVVLSLCLSGFFLVQRKDTFISPIARIEAKLASGSINNQEKVADECNTLGLSCSNIKENGNTITFVINTSIIYISTTKDIKMQLDSLQLTIRQLTMEGKEFKGLDFRYDRPVISN